MASLAMGILFVRKASRTSRDERRRGRSPATAEPRKPEDQDGPAKLPIVILGPDRCVALAFREGETKVAAQVDAAGASAQAFGEGRPMSAGYSGHAGMEPGVTSSHRGGVPFVVTVIT